MFLFKYGVESGESELYEKPENEFVAQFIGSPSMNLLSGKITGTGETTRVALDGGGEIASLVPTTDADLGKSVNIGIRPEDFVQTDSDAYAYEGKVDITEALGEVTLLYFEGEWGAGEGVIGKLPGIHKELRGKTVRMTADPDKVHMFHEGRSLLYR